jgi:putative membrane protein insertion efficiency factor
LKNKRKEQKKGKNKSGQNLHSESSPHYDGAVTFLIKFYRRFISPLKKPCCRFTPTCSQYALDAVREWGVLFGISLAIWRILRCNPFSAGGYDPVPENPFKKGK